MNSKGRFISIEGGEGSGKSTNIKFIADFLAERGKNVVLTREPGGTKLGEALRAILLAPETTANEDAELLLMFAARSQHIQEVILPALGRGDWVISDRFTDSSYAYQGSARGIEFSRIDTLEAWALKGVKPDLTFYLDIDPKVGLRRAEKRAELDRFEREQMNFFEQVRSGFLKRVTSDPHRIKFIDANQDLQAVQAQLSEHLSAFIEND